MPRLAPELSRMEHWNAERGEKGGSQTSGPGTDAIFFSFGSRGSRNAGTHANAREGLRYTPEPLLLVREETREGKGVEARARLGGPHRTPRFASADARIKRTLKELSRDLDHLGLPI